MNKEVLTEETVKQWSALLDECRGVEKITDSQQRNVLVRLLENTVQYMAEQTPASNTNTASVDNFDPILINMIRRTQPNLVANQIVGVQPMSGPTGLIFAMRANTQKNAKGATPGALNTDVFAGEPDETLTRVGSTESMGSDTEVAYDPELTGAQTAGVYQTNAWSEMGFDIEKQTVTAYGRALKARYTVELAQDLKAVHNLDAEAILADMLATEIVAEQDREIIGLINAQAKLAKLTAGAGQIRLPAGVVGAADGQIDVTAAGFDGRWSAEIYHQLLNVVEKMANQIAIDTRRGRGNFIICSPNVVTALESAGKFAPAYTAVDDGITTAPDVTGVTMVGVLNRRYKVYMDPYATADYVTVGYKGANAYDAGIFLAPYVPLQFMRATGEEDFDPRLGFKTRYAIAANPFAGTGTAAKTFNADPIANRTDLDGQNQYYQRATVANL